MLQVHSSLAWVAPVGLKLLKPGVHSAFLQMLMFTLHVWIAHHVPPEPLIYTHCTDWLMCHGLAGHTVFETLTLLAIGDFQYSFISFKTTLSHPVTDDTCKCSGVAAHYMSGNLCLCSNCMTVSYDIRNLSIFQQLIWQSCGQSLGCLFPSNTAWQKMAQSWNLAWFWRLLCIRKIWFKVGSNCPVCTLQNHFVTIDRQRAKWCWNLLFSQV